MYEGVFLTIPNQIEFKALKLTVLVGTHHT